MAGLLRKQITDSRCPVGTEHLGLLQNQLCGFGLEVGRVAVLFQDAANPDSYGRSGIIAKGPVDGYSGSNPIQHLGGDDLEFVEPHAFDSGLVSSEGVVKANLVFAQPKSFATVLCCLEVLRGSNQLFDPLLTAAVRDHFGNAPGDQSKSHVSLGTRFNPRIDHCSALRVEPGDDVVRLAGDMDFRVIRQSGEETPSSQRSFAAPEG